MDGQTEMPLHHGIPLSNKKEISPDMHSDLDRAQKHYAEGKTRQESVYSRIPFYLYKTLGKKKKSHQKQWKADQGMPQSRTGWDQGTREPSGALQMFYNVVMPTVYACQKSHCTSKCILF